MKNKKTIIFTILALLFSFLKSNSISVKALEENWDYENSLDNAESINQDFKAYYLTKFMGGLSVETVTEEQNERDHWYITNNTVARANDVATNLNADSLAMLYFTKYK